MKKIFFKYYTGFCGSDGYAVDEFDDGVTDEELNRFAWEGALSNAEMYGIYPMENAPDDYDDEDYGGDEYSDNIEGCWEVYVEEKHAGYV